MSFQACLIMSLASIAAEALVLTRLNPPYPLQVAWFNLPTVLILLLIITSGLTVLQ